MTSPTPTRARPDGVTLTAAWFIIGAVFWLLAVLAMLVFAFPAVLRESTTGLDRYLAVAGVSFGLFVVSVFAAANLSAAIGLLRVRPWGRVLSIVLAAMGLLAFPIGTVVGALIIWYMLSDEAKESFSPTSETAAVSGIDSRAA
jgi:hypothetical protein